MKQRTTNRLKWLAWHGIDVFLIGLGVTLIDKALSDPFTLPGFLLLFGGISVMRLMAHGKPWGRW